MNRIKSNGRKSVSKGLVLIALVGISLLLVAQPLFSLADSIFQTTTFSAPSISNMRSSFLASLASNPVKKVHHNRADPPMGIADYGQNGNSHYEYYASSFEGQTQFYRLYLYGCTGNDPACTVNDQLNSVATLYECNFADTFCRYGYYWIQDLTFISQTGPTTFNVGLWDNIWNFTNQPVGCNNMSMGQITGGGSVGSSGCTTFYVNFASYSYSGLKLPFEVFLFSQAYTNAGGNAEIDFTTEACYGPGFGTCDTNPPFDQVVFGGFGKACSTCAGENAFVVGGSGAELSQDVENILGGMWNGETIGIPLISVAMSIGYAPQFQACCPYFIPHAYSTGLDTGETATGVMMSLPYGCCVAFGESGTDNDIQLY